MSRTELYPPPSDGISKICFGTNASTSLLAASTWAGSLSVYETASGTLRVEYGKAQEHPPLLDCCWVNEYDIVTANTSGQVLLYNLNSTLPASGRIVGKHDLGVRCTQYASDISLVITGSWDCSIKGWDVRTPSEQSSFSVPVSGKVFAMTTYHYTSIVGTSKKKLEFFDLRRMERPWSVQDSPIKHQIRSIACSLDGKRFAVGSTEGRVAINPLPISENHNLESTISEKKNEDSGFSFKCHRQSAAGPDVNAIEFHPIYGTFATGGADGIVNIWDAVSKKRITQLDRYPSSISSLSFHSDGTCLAIASSYTFEEGERDHPSDALYLYQIRDYEVMPRGA
eukprot:jgi/Galph1/1914/GphlegSOOS_G611.1